MENIELHIDSVANKIRQILLEEFPNFPDLTYQCKRASILFDLYAKQQSISSYPTAGFITKQGDTNSPERGHVWNIVTIGNESYILDITLTQYQTYLELDVPPIIFMPIGEAIKRYAYCPDGYGEYRYEIWDVRKNLVEKVLQIE